MKLEDRFWEKVNIRDDNSCWLWTGSKDKKGYGLFRVGKTSHHAHRMAWELFNNKSIPQNILACHSCDNPSCCNPKHIFLGTAKDNSDDMIIKGRARHNGMFGLHNPRTTVLPETVREIRKLYATGQYTYKQIATLTGITYVTVWDIVKNKRRIND